MVEVWEGKMTDTELTRRCTKREEIQKLEKTKKYYEQQIEFYNNCIQ